MVRYHGAGRNWSTVRPVLAKRMSAVMICVAVAAASAGISAAEPVRAESAGRSGERWTASLVRTARTMEKYDFRYSYSAPGGSLAAALKGNRMSNCSKYVSWALQDYGVLRKGQTFWITKSGAIRGSTEAIKGNSRLKVLHPARPAAKAGLRPGDICGWSGMMHTAVYAGKNSKGQMLWYSAGRDGAAKKGGRWFFRAARMKARPRASHYSGKICTVIRIRNLKYGTGQVESADSGGDRIESSAAESAGALLAIPDSIDLLDTKDESAEAGEDCAGNEAGEEDETDEASEADGTEGAAAAERSMDEGQKSQPAAQNEENPFRDDAGRDRSGSEDENRCEVGSGSKCENGSDTSEQDISGEKDRQEVSEETGPAPETLSGGNEEAGSPEESSASGEVKGRSSGAGEPAGVQASGVSSEIHSSEDSLSEDHSSEAPETGDHDWLRDAAAIVLALNGIYLLRRVRVPGR